MTQRALARQLATEAIEQGRPLAWFETLYDQAAGDPTSIPWADGCINPNLQQWIESKSMEPAGKRALVVGCGLGDDTEYLQSLGYQTTGFDISASAIAWCNKRFGDSSAQYTVADVLDLPKPWHRNFDFVAEIYTLQVLPKSLRETAAEAIGACVAEGGTMLVITRGREESDVPGAMPWPLIRGELQAIQTETLQCVHLEDYVDDEVPPVRRFRAEYRRGNS